MGERENPKAPWYIGITDNETHLVVKENWTGVHTAEEAKKELVVQLMGLDINKSTAPLILAANPVLERAWNAFKEKNRSKHLLMAEDFYEFLIQYTEDNG